MRCALWTVLAISAAGADASSTSPTNATDTCDTRFEKGLRGVAKLYFKEDCVAALESNKFNCPMNTLNTLLEEYVGGLRIESFFISCVSLLALICLMQFGGIPCPDGPFGTLLWFAYMLIFLFQIFVEILSVAMVVASFILMRDEFSPCLKSWKWGWSLLDVSAFLTFVTMPVVVFRLAYIALSMLGIAQTFKVWWAARICKGELDAGDVNSGACYGASKFRDMLDDDEGSGEERIVFEYVLGVLEADRFSGIIFSAFVVIMLFSVSLSCFTATAFFFPPFMGCFMGIAIAPVICYRGLSYYARGITDNTENLLLKELNRAALWTAAGWEILRGETLYQRQKRATLEREMAAERGITLPTSICEEHPNTTVFGKVASVIFIILIFSPVYIMGVWFAVYVYTRRHSTSDHMHFISVMYNFTFQIFLNGTFSIPNFALDFTDFPTIQSCFDYIADFWLFGESDSKDYFKGAHAMDTLNFVLGFVKTGLALLTSLIAVYGKYASNAPFSLCIQTDSASDLAKHDDFPMKAAKSKSDEQAQLIKKVESLEGRMETLESGMKSLQMAERKDLDS